MENKYATLFGGGLNDRNTLEYTETILIGELLAEKGYIVKNGGYRGLMEAVSKGVANKNGFSIGYTCETFNYTKGNKYLSELNVEKDIYNRLRSLMLDSSVFIIQKGGIGTLSELTLLLDNIRKMDNPPKILIVSETWKPFIKLLENIMPIIDQELIIFCKPEEIINYI